MSVANSPAHSPVPSRPVTPALKRGAMCITQSRAGSPAPTRPSTPASKPNVKFAANNSIKSPPSSRPGTPRSKPNAAPAADNPEAPTAPTRPGPRPTPSETGSVNIPLLARICDDIRASVVSHRTTGRWPHITALCGLLSAFLGDEDSPQTRIGLDTIRACRLDRLLDDILDPANRPIESPISREFAELERMARRLQRKWMGRFGEDYSALDDVRCREMTRTGRMRGVRFDTSGRPGWKVVGGDPPSDRGLETGNWFVSMAGAYIQGMTGDSIENLSFGGTKVLPILWGKEEVMGPDHPDLVRYVRDGKYGDMIFSLISHVGRRVHLLRGYKLRSPFAPAAGIRYDGVYTLRSYALKLDPQTETYRMTLTSDRVPGQIPLETLKIVPRPAELDDWRLCDRIEEKEMIRAGRGRKYAAWRREEHCVNVSV
ncbi:uncharacterized protein DNG_07180 [Cephalotrichum gorgonifer]|uniref:YDG domain-containing protein n=1 Tax=Cephalotrichum gorgonifer TaxID=2041049 RepID=A0AAE8N449_9PEZI|nr:uncharacterized protein DNG_07180 [Cephalotrichum gorgonifer]